MTPDGIREKFDFYRKWFQTLLIKEFVNLPKKHQEMFINMLSKFQNDCKKIYDEAKDIKEKLIKIKIKSINFPDNKRENFIINGIVEKSDNEVIINYPATKKIPQIGDFIRHILFSTDGIEWYASKEDLIKGRRMIL